jgi:hypothetical protein
MKLMSMLMTILGFGKYMSILMSILDHTGRQKKRYIAYIATLRGHRVCLFSAYIIATFSGYKGYRIQ